MATRLGPRFDRLSIAAGASNIGDGVFGAAFPLLVATLTREPMLVAGAALAGRAPWFFFALISGALVDRMDRKRVMVVTDVLRSVGVGMMAWGVATDSVGLVAVYLLAFGLGVAETFFDTSAEAMIPALVEEERLPAANGRLQGLEWVGGAFIGPPVGAILFVAAVALPFAINAVSFAVAAIFILLIPGSFRSQRSADVVTLRADIASGIRWLWSQRVVRTLALMAGATNMGTFAVIATFVLFAQDILSVTDTGYGILLSALGVGGLIGALLIARVVRAIGPGNTIRVTLLAQIAVMATYGFTSSPWVAGVLMLAVGALITAWNVVAVSLRQELTPDNIRGRVAGASRLLAWGTQPLGALLGGVVASAFGLRAPFFMAATVFMVATSLVWRVVSNESIARARERATPV